MKKICIGKIAAAHGIKGMVKIIPFCEDLSLLEGDILTGQGDTVSVSLKNPIGKYVLAAIKDVQDRNTAEALNGTELFISREELPNTDENSFYVEDLIGLEVVESGETIGTVTGVDNFGAGDLLDIRLSATGKNFYLPFQDAYVGEIGETIVVRDYERFIL